MTRTSKILLIVQGTNVVAYNTYIFMHKEPLAPIEIAASIFGILVLGFLWFARVRK